MSGDWLDEKQDHFADHTEKFKNIYTQVFEKPMNLSSFSWYTELSGSESQTLLAELDRIQAEINAMPAGEDRIYVADYEHFDDSLYRTMAGFSWIGVQTDRGKEAAEMLLKVLDRVFEGDQMMLLEMFDEIDGYEPFLSVSSYPLQSQKLIKNSLLQMKDGKYSEIVYFSRPDEIDIWPANTVLEMFRWQLTESALMSPSGSPSMSPSRLPSRPPAKSSSKSPSMSPSMLPSKPPARSYRKPTKYSK